MHYTCRKGNQSAPHIELLECDGTVSKVLTSPTMHWLGVYFDQKLLFNHHVTKMAAKAEAAVVCISMLANTVQGLSHSHLCLLYCTCILPILTYTSAAWWTGKQHHIQILNKVQNRTLHLICAAFHTTPIHALEIEASIPPLGLHLDSLTKKTAICFNKLSTNNPIIQWLPDEWCNGANPSVPPPLPTTTLSSKKPTQLQKTATHTSPQHERIFPFLLPPWRKTSTDYKGHLTINIDTSDKDDVIRAHNSFLDLAWLLPNALLVYSDGSQKSILKCFRCTGAAAIGYHLGREIFHCKLGMGGSAEVYDTELMGLTIGLNEAITYVKNHPDIKHIYIYADNVSALSAVIDPKPCQGQLLAHVFYRNTLKWLDTSPTHHLSLSWCPGHSKIRGNKRADQLAKEATSLPGLTDPTTTWAL